MYLVCRTNGDDGCDIAQVPLRRLLLKRLLEYRDAWKAAKATIPTLYSLELFDYEAVYATRQRVMTPAKDVEYGAWRRVSHSCIPEGKQLSVSSATLVVTEDGVYWQAAHKHADTPRTFETERLLFDDLLNYATGGAPWELLEVAAETT